MPRIETTRTVKFALMLLRTYLILMLMLIVTWFARSRNSPRGGEAAGQTQVNRMATTAAAPTSQHVPATQDSR